MLNLIKKKVYKVFKNIKYQRVNFYVKKIESVALIYKSSNYTKELIEAIKYIEDDFNFDFINFSETKISSDQLLKYDFVLVYDFWEGEIDRFISQAKVNIPKGLIISNLSNPKSSLRIYDYNVIWFKSFFYGKKFIRHPRMFHAVGVFLDGKKDLSENNSPEKVLYGRLSGLESKNDNLLDHFKEFVKSPIWDIKYYGNQIRLGINSLIEQKKVSQTNLIKSTVNLKVGRNSFFNKNLVITGDEYVEIGSFCSFGKNVTIYTSNHDVNYPTTQGFLYRKYFHEFHPGENLNNPSRSRTKGPVVIKNDVWIGDDVKIMSGVTIGNGACIAGGSIVTKNVPDYAIVAGVPAKVIKMRVINPQKINYLLELGWWDWSEKKIKENRSFFFNKIEE